LKIVDVTNVKFTVQTEKLPDEFGRKLDTLEKARRWLTNPHNWFVGNLYVLKWDGVFPKVRADHGMRLIEETWDWDLCGVVVRQQKRIREGMPVEVDSVVEE
jgi:hypothetical protein